MGLRFYRNDDDVSFDYTFPVPPSLPIVHERGMGYIEHQNDFGVGIRVQIPPAKRVYTFHFYGLTNEEADYFLNEIYEGKLASGAHWFYVEFSYVNDEGETVYLADLSGKKFVIAGGVRTENSDTGLYRTLDIQIEEWREVVG